MLKYIQIVSISHLPREAIYGNKQHDNFKWDTKVITVLLHKLNVPNEEVYGVTNQITRRKFSMMFDNFQAYDVQETRRVSREVGILEGEQLLLIKLVIKKLEKQYSAEQIAEFLEEPLDTIQPIYDIALRQSPDYDADKIFEKLNSDD